VRISRLFLGLALLVAPAIVVAQDAVRDTLPTAGSAPGVRPSPPDSLVLPLPSALRPLGQLAPRPASSAAFARERAAALARSLERARTTLWRAIVTTEMTRRGQGPRAARAGLPDGLLAPRDTEPRTATGTDLFGQHATLGLALQSRIETKVERDRNERCLATDVLTPIANCFGAFQPQFNFQFGVKTGGVVADRVHLNIDYDSQREFDASNNIGVTYEGRPDEILQRVEVGNVSFAPPPSRFITAGIPSGNYGIQAIGQLGPMSFRAIAAQQRGNVVRDRVFLVGDRTLQTVDREIEDYQLERRRFFWVVDPRKAFPSQYPNIDILDPALPSLAAQIPPGERPRRVLVYRYRSPTATGSAAADINGPYAVTRYARNTNVIGPYEILQQGVDYYIDPTNLWIALVNPLGRDERLAVSYTVTGPDGRERVVPSVGGTFPTRRGLAGRDTVNLLWDNQVLPGDSVFDREIRSVYRLGGSEVQRQSVTVKIVVGSASDQEKPVGGTVDTYLQLFGLAQRTNASAFDVENRLWPRVGDPNQALTTTGTTGGVASPSGAEGAGGGGVQGSGAGAPTAWGGESAKLIRDYFIIFPSLMPFADSGLVHPPNPVNDSLYRITDEDLSSPRRPPTQYRIRVHYSAEGSGEAGSLMLGSVQVRPGSERLFLDGRQLVRDVDYRVDYELGRVTFIRPDTLFPRPRQVSVQFEENPLFAAAPTSILGLVTQFPTEHGTLSLTALSQSQQSTFNRPPLGFEPASALLAGVSGNFTWESTLLTRLLDKLPLVDATAPSAVNVQGEFAMSRPQPNAAGAAYVETFEGEGGLDVPLQESAWRYGSQPAVRGAGVRIGSTTYDFPLDSATTLAWQSLGSVLDPGAHSGTTVQFFPEQIDSQFVLIGGQSFRAPEPVLWLNLYPPGIGGLPNASGSYRWRLTPGDGRPWRSISQSLSPTGVDLSHVEQLELWALVDTSSAGRPLNPALVLDFGDISENSINFAPETLLVQPAGSGADSVYTGRALQGYDRLDTERDPVTQSFDVARNDNGLPGDVADTLVVRDLIRGTTTTELKVPLCHRGPQPVLPLGDATADCTVGNRRLDEEDLDRDGFLNIRSDARNTEPIVRFVLDLATPATYTKVGRCYVSMTDTSTTTPGPRRVCWVKIAVPFGAPTEVLNAPVLRRIKSVRLTVVGGPGRHGNTFTRVAIARLRLTGSPWTKRTDAAIAGIGGTRVDVSGTMIATTIGTQDRDPRGNLFYESPPGVTDEPDSKGGVYSPGTIQVNEKSLRLIAVNVPLFHRAEAYYRFPEGERNFMAYRELRVWARGRGKGWGPDGDLQFFIKVGRDADNFYLYRTPINEGTTRDAWLPEVRIDLRRFYALRARLENAFLHGNGTDTLACTGLDSALIAASELTPGSGGPRYAVCDGGYVVYTSNPAVSAPNLAAVQELAVGFVRTRTDGRGTGGPITPLDSLELWVDDIRLTGVVDDPGYAGQIGLNVAAGDVGTLQVSASRRDGNFRQLGEQPSFITDNELALASSVRLDKFLPRSLGIVLPLTVNHTATSGDPLFLSSSDLTASAVDGIRSPRSSATSYTLALRRATPLEHSILAPLVNNLTLTSTYVAAAARSEFQSGTTSAFSGGLDYTLVAQGRTIHTPGWLRALIDRLPSWLRNMELLRAMRDATLRWNPTQVRFTSTYARNADRRESFLLPVTFARDTGRRVTGLEDVWRNTAAIELRPFNSLSARFDLSSLRDLRDYGDSTSVSVVAGTERERFLGMDVGLERERQMSTAVSLAPPLAPWIRPRVDLTTTFSLLRDPNARSLLRTGDTTGEFRLPRRVGNSQGLAVSATVDLARAIALYTSDSSALRPLMKILSPIDIQWRRDLRSAFDGVPFDPSPGYQLALGGVDAFREVNGVLATSAGVARNLVIGHSLFLPLGLTLTNRFSSVRATSWSRVATIQTLLEAEQRTFPDVSLRWSYTPPAWLQGVFTSVAAQVGARITRTNSFQPTVGDATFIPGIGLRTEQTLTQYPITGSITWSVIDGLSTSAGWNHIGRREIRSGGLTEGGQDDITLDLAKTIGLPRSWTLRSNQLRTRLGYQSTHTQSFFVQDDTRKRVTDNGRWAVTASADSDVSDTMSLSFLLARVLTYDNAYDRRFSQTVFSVAFHLQFQAGELQ
jgi:hypothetical protein